MTQSSNPSSRTELSVHPAIDLITLYRYHKLKPKIAIARNRYYKTHAQVLRIANSYFEAMPEADIVIRLRREIRMATRGTPETIATESITAAGYVTFGTEQLFNAQAHLVKRAYRKIAPLVHPDKGGDPELFRLVNAAYHLRDLTYLQELYIQLAKDSLWYRCSQEAIEYLQQEIERPVVSLRMLQNLPVFAIAQAHLAGHSKAAKSLAVIFIAELIGALNNELHYLITKNLSHNGVNNVKAKEGDGNTSPNRSEEETQSEASQGSEGQRSSSEDSSQENW